MIDFRGRTLLILLCLVARAGAQSGVGPDSSSRGILVLRSIPTGAEIILDGRVAGRTPFRDSTVDAGIHRTVLYFPSHLAWGALSVADSLSVRPGVCTERLLLIPGNIPSALTLPADSSSSDQDALHSVVRRRASPWTDVPKPLVEGTQGMSERQWWAIGAGGTGIVAGVFAVSWKGQANAANDQYLLTNDPSFRDRTTRLDRRFAAAMVVFEASALVLAYVLLSE